MRERLKLWHVIAIVALGAPLSVWGADTMWSALSALTGVNVASDDRIPLLDVSDTTHGAGGTAKTITASELKNNYMHRAGSASAGSWPIFGNGTLLTAAEDGAFEQDANAFYLTTDADNRGYVPVRHCTRQAASRSLTSSTAEQAIFDAAQDTLTLETGTYFMHAMIYVTGLSATSGNFAFDFIGAGTATAADILYHGVGIDNTTPTNAGTQTGSFAVAQQSVASLVTAGTGTGAAVSLRGTFEVTGSGTIIPSVTLVTAAAGTVAAGTYFCVERWGALNVTSVGQWN